jgi:hypothetical protein
MRPGKIKIRSMTPDTDGNSDEMSPSESERGDLLGAMKRYALEGYLRLGAGNAEQFEKMWREAFFANEPAKPISPDLSGRYNDCRFSFKVSRATKDAHQNSMRYLSDHVCVNFRLAIVSEQPIYFPVQYPLIA